MADDIILDAENVDAARRPPGLLLDLPDELMEWAMQNHEMIRRVQGALANTYAGLTDDQVWEAVAEAASPEWRRARDDLRTVETQWTDLQRPENAALGLIGQALDSDEVEQVRDHMAISLSQFTIINEGLRARPDLSNLLSVLLVQKKMLDHSGQHTQKAAKASALLGDLVPISPFFNAAAHKPTRLQKQFRNYAKRLLEAGRRRPDPMNVIVPWSPGI